MAPELSAEKLRGNTRTVFCRKGHPLAGAKSLRELIGAEWLTTSITYDAEEELSALFVRNRLPLPKLAVRSQSALTMIVSLANSDLLAMLPVQWSTFSLTANALMAIDIGELLPALPTVIIKRRSYPLTPAAEYLLDLVRQQKDRPEAPASSKNFLLAANLEKPAKSRRRPV